MECRIVQCLLALIRPGGDELDAAEQAALQSHLRDCPQCRRLEAAEAEIHERLRRAMRSVVVPAGLKDRLLARLEQERRRRVRRWSAAAAAALILAAVLGFWAYAWRDRAVDLEQLQAEAERQLAQLPHDAQGIEQFFLKEYDTPLKLPAEFKELWNLEYLTGAKLTRVDGQVVPTLEFCRDELQAVVMFVPRAKARPHQLEEVTDPTHALPFRVLGGQKEDEYIALIAFRGQGSSSLFTKPVKPNKT